MSTLTRKISRRKAGRLMGHRIVMQEPEELGVQILQPYSKAYKHLYTRIRDRDTTDKDFGWYASRLMSMLAEEAIAALPSKPKQIITPTSETYEGYEVNEDKVCVVSIIRAGDALMETVRKLLPQSTVGKILIQRDETTPEKLPKLFYSKLPHDVTSRSIILCDPMLATGGSARCAIEVLVKEGVNPSQILFLNVVSCPEGIRAVKEAYPEVTIVTGEIDAGLNENKHIVPGLGDYGDRFFGTTGTD